MRAVVLAAAIGMAATSAFASPNSAPNALQLRCVASDPVTGQPKTVFAPGDNLGLQVYINVPAHRAVQRVAIKTYLFAKVKGFNLGGRVSDGVIEIPPESVREELPGYDTGVKDAVIGGFESRNALPYYLETVHIPSKFPEGDATVRVEATVGGEGENARTVRCGPTVRIRNP